MRRALKKTGLELPLHVVSDGKAALDYLDGVAEYADRERYPLPLLVFLDLKLPYLNGFEVLEWIRHHPVVRELNVVILTSSDEERDSKRAQELGVSGYLVKPPRPETLTHTLQAFLERVPKPQLSSLP
jgi:CheY-like chemotaxis protein